MSIDPKKLLGEETDSDKKVSVRLGDWNAMKLHAYNSKTKWETVALEAERLLEGCAHLDGCPAADNEAVACLGLREMKRAFAQIGVNATEEDGVVPAVLPAVGFAPQAAELGCPDREKRISILVILNCAREFAAIDARRPAEGRYFAPSREYFSKMIAELGATQIEVDELRAKLSVPTKEVS